MPTTESSTRQRLLELWEKCPECHGSLQWMGEHPTGIPQWNLDFNWIPEYAAFARDAMEGYLLKRRMNPMLGYDGIFYKVEIAHVDFVGEIRSFVREDRTDALISAVEAVMEKE